MRIDVMPCARAGTAATSDEINAVPNKTEAKALHGRDSSVLNRKEENMKIGSGKAASFSCGALQSRPQDMAARNAFKKHHSIPSEGHSESVESRTGTKFLTSRPQTEHAGGTIY
jgi:hypothetical protein